MMHGIRSGRLPSSETIVEEAFEELGYVPDRVTADEAKAYINVMLHTAWERTLEVLERYERETYGENVADALVRHRAGDFREAETISQRQGFSQAVRFLFSRWYPYLVEVFLSISQSRKQRGGKDFELQFGKMLSLMRIPHERIDRKYRVDFIMPDSSTLALNKTVAIIASAKRTLRERWREVVEELHNTRAPNIFLITADYDVGAGHVDQICDRYNIHLVVWDSVKEGLFPTRPLVVGYTSWANERIPALRQFWPTEFR
jgi:hypothetical protein